MANLGPIKNEVQINGTSANVGSPFTFQIPTHDIDVKTHASIGYGLETTNSSKKGLKKEGTPR